MERRKKVATDLRPRAKFCFWIPLNVLSIWALGLAALVWFLIDFSIGFFVLVCLIGYAIDSQLRGIVFTAMALRCLSSMVVCVTSYLFMRNHRHLVLWMNVLIVAGIAHSLGIAMMFGSLLNLADRPYVPHIVYTPITAPDYGSMLHLLLFFVQCLFFVLTFVFLIYSWRCGLFRLLDKQGYENMAPEDESSEATDDEECDVKTIETLIIEEHTIKFAQDASQEQLELNQVLSTILEETGQTFDDETAKKSFLQLDTAKIVASRVTNNAKLSITDLVNEMDKKLHT